MVNLKFWTWFSKDYIDVYCQRCGTDITSKGGEVIGDSRVYCKSDGIETFLGCAKKHLIRNPFIHGKEALRYDAREVQEAIKEKEITKYCSLERKVGK